MDVQEVCLALAGPAGVLEIPTTIPVDARYSFPVVLTGGEPLLQIDRELTTGLASVGYAVHVETNGSEDAAQKCSDIGALTFCDEVVISPKTEDISSTVLAYGSALKVLVPFPRGVTESVVRACVERLGTFRSRDPKLILQPMTPIEGQNHHSFFANCNEAVRLATRWLAELGERWCVVPQTHVTMRLK